MKLTKTDLDTSKANLEQRTLELQTRLTDEINNFEQATKKIEELTHNNEIDTKRYTKTIENINDKLKTSEQNFAELEKNNIRLNKEIDDSKRIHMDNITALQQKFDKLQMDTNSEKEIINKQVKQLQDDLEKTRAAHMEGLKQTDKESEKERQRLHDNCTRLEQEGEVLKAKVDSKHHELILSNQLCNKLSIESKQQIDELNNKLHIESDENLQSKAQLNNLYIVIQTNKETIDNLQNKLQIESKEKEDILNKLEVLTKEKNHLRNRTTSENARVQKPNCTITRNNCQN